MNANELRIGNILNYQRYKTIRQGIVTTINPNKVTMDHCKAIKYNSNDLIPIPLTEDYLLKFGFKKVNDGYITIETFHYENKNCWIYLLEDGFELELNTLSERHNLCRVYNYVHELQNLYWILLGQELTLNE